MRILVTGATGMVGSEVIRQAIEDPGISRVTALVRKPMDITHPKLRSIIHRDFTNYDVVEDILKEQDACIWALGISQTKVKSEKEYRLITLDFAIAAGYALIKANPAIRYLFVSGEGTDTTMKSRTLFARVKGETENELNKMPFGKLYIVRPGFIKPVNGNPGAAWYERMLYPLFPVFRLFAPKFTITSVELARVMLHIIKEGGSESFFRNADLYERAKHLRISS